MQTIEALRRKIKSAQDLLSVVKTMKALAAVNIRHYERAVEALTEYNRTVEMGLHVVLHAREETLIDPDRAALPWLNGEAGGHGVGCVLFGSDQGLCGQFNERIVTHAQETLNGMHIPVNQRTFLAVGERCALLLDDAGQPLDGLLDTPGGMAGVTPLVEELLLRIDGWRAGGRTDRILLFHNRPMGGGLYGSRTVQLLPLDLDRLHAMEEAPWPSRCLPTFTMDWSRLFSLLIRHSLFVALFRACAESLAAEDAARLASMQNAQRNIEDRLEELNARYHHQRQNTITAELLDIVSGFEAVNAV